jgi:hypothetical protein
MAVVLNEARNMNGVPVPRLMQSVNQEKGRADSDVI